MCELEDELSEAMAKRDADVQLRQQAQVAKTIAAKRANAVAKRDRLAQRRNQVVGEYERTLLLKVHVHFVYPVKSLSQFQLLVSYFTMPRWSMMIFKMVMPLVEVKLQSGKNLAQTPPFASET